MLVISAALFASQFLFNKKFEEKHGSSLGSAMLFSLYTSVGGFAVLFALNGFKISFSVFSFAYATVYAVVGVLYTVASTKALESVNLSVYSVFAMLGGMLLPFVFGIAFRDEELTPMKLACCTLIVLATMLTVDFKAKSGKKIHYLAVFLLNGTVGVISVVHQSGKTAVDSLAFLMLARAVSAFVSFVWLAVKSREAIFSLDISDCVCCLGYSAFCGIGNLLVLVALTHLSASVQYPIITGGTMAFSFVISLLRREKYGKRDAFSVALAVVSSVLIVF